MDSSGSVSKIFFNDVNFSRSMIHVSDISLNTT